jgi:hypothetical protein
MFSLALIIFVVSEKKAFEHFPIESNVNLFPAVSEEKNLKKSPNQKQELPVVAMFVNGSGTK